MSHDLVKMVFVAQWLTFWTCQWMVFQVFILNALHCYPENLYTHCSVSVCSRNKLELDLISRIKRNVRRNLQKLIINVTMFSTFGGKSNIHRWKLSKIALYGTELLPFNVPNCRISSLATTILKQF